MSNWQNNRSWQTGLFTEIPFSNLSKLQKSLGRNAVLPDKPDEEYLLLQKKEVNRPFSARNLYSLSFSTLLSANRKGEVIVVLVNKREHELNLRYSESDSGVILELKIKYRVIHAINAITKVNDVLSELEKRCLQIITKTFSENQASQDIIEKVKATQISDCGVQIDDVVIENFVKPKEKTTNLRESPKFLEEWEQNLERKAQTLQEQEAFIATQNKRLEGKEQAWLEEKKQIAKQIAKQLVEKKQKLEERENSLQEQEEQFKLEKARTYQEQEASIATQKKRLGEKEQACLEQYKEFAKQRQQLVEQKQKLQERENLLQEQEKQFKLEQAEKVKMNSTNVEEYEIKTHVAIVYDTKHNVLDELYQRLDIKGVGFCYLFSNQLGIIEKQQHLLTELLRHYHDSKSIFLIPTALKPVFFAILNKISDRYNIPRWDTYKEEGLDEVKNRFLKKVIKKHIQVENIALSDISFLAIFDSQYQLAVSIQEKRNEDRTREQIIRDLLEKNATLNTCCNQEDLGELTNQVDDLLSQLSKAKEISQKNKATFITLGIVWGIAISMLVYMFVYFLS